MIATFALVLAATNFLLIYGLHQLHTAHERRIKALEARKPEPEKRVNIPTIQQLYPPVENFIPKKPETLRPNQVRGREILENVYEFDAKI